MPVNPEKILFRNVSILDSTGADPYPGDVLVENDRIAAVGTVGQPAAAGARVIDGRGRTLMSGLCDAHTHFSWNNSADLDGLGTMPVEEHLLFCLESARTYIDSGYTMCLGAASAKDRLDVVCRDAINAGRFPGPRYLANGPEIAVTGGALIKSITKFADGPEGMRKAVRELVDLGVDQIKLSMTGEEITGTQRAEDTYFSDEECAAAVTEAHRRGKRVCAHARSAESVKMCVRNHVNIVYHASFTDAEGMDMLEANKDWVFVAPGINWLIATLYEADAFGFPQEAAEAVGYKKELEMAEAGLREMHRRGIKILPGGDYGFAWTPHGTYARDLEHFVERLGFTPMEAIISATAWGGQIMLRPDELGKVQPGYLADLILIDGNPLDDITILQDHDKLHYIMKDGRFHKEPGDEPPHRPTKTNCSPAAPRPLSSSAPDQHPSQRQHAAPGSHHPDRRGMPRAPRSQAHAMTLLICRTCPRYNTRSTGQFSRDLTDAIAADGRDITIRKVQCLGGCPDDGVAAVDGPGMTRVRFTSLTSHDAAAIITATLAHQTSTTGDPDDWEMNPPNSPPGSPSPQRP